MSNGNIETKYYKPASFLNKQDALNLKSDPREEYLVNSSSISLKMFKGFFSLRLNKTKYNPDLREEFLDDDGTL